MSRVLTYISELTIPLIILLVVGYGYLEKEKVYEAFLEGAGEGLNIVIKLVPTLVGLMVAVGMLRASGILEGVEHLLGSLTRPVGLPASLLPLLVIKLFSASAATGLVFDVFETFGTDSFAGLFTSILMSCTETVFYTLSVYFLAAKVTKTRFTLTGALLATAAGTVASYLLARFMVAP